MKRILIAGASGYPGRHDGLTYDAVAYQAGVKRFVSVSVFGADDMSELKMVAAKIRFERSLRDSGVPYVIIRPNGFFSNVHGPIGFFVTVLSRDMVAPPYGSRTLREWFAGRSAVAGETR